MGHKSHRTGTCGFLTSVRSQHRFQFARQHRGQSGPGAVYAASVTPDGELPASTRRWRRRGPAGAPGRAPWLQDRSAAVLQPWQSRPDASHPKHPPARPPAFTAWRHRCRGRWRPRTRWRAGLSPDPAAAWSDRRGRRRGSCASDRWSSTSGRQTAPVGTAAHRHDKISISRPLVTDVNIGRVLQGEVFRYGRRDFVPVLQAFLQESAVTGAQNSPR
jgi:hypothetical protein